MVMDKTYEHMPHGAYVGSVGAGVAGGDGSFRVSTPKGLTDQALLPRHLQIQWNLNVTNSIVINQILTPDASPLP
jgi:hypothetical protein